MKRSTEERTDEGLIAHTHTNEELDYNVVGGVGNGKHA